ncbi:MAG: TolC family protein [Clostridium sp.]|nr:TolC family protein [Clostridium sp.]
MRRDNRRRAALMAAVFLCLMPAGPVYAAGPGSTDEELEQDMALQARLQDNVLEFDEIAGRIEKYNPTYKNTRNTINAAVLNMDAADLLTEEASDLMDEAREIREDDRVLYEEYRSMSHALRREAQKMTNGELPTAQKNTLLQVRGSLARVVENLLIQYHTVQAQTEVAQKAVELAQANVNMQMNLAAAGLASQADVLSAEQGLLSAQKGLEQASSGLLTIRQSIQVLLGWNADDSVEFAPIPDADMARIMAMNPAADSAAAIGTNYDLRSVKNTSAKGAVNRAVKKRNVSVSEQTIQSAMEKLYREVEAKLQGVQASESSWQAAQNDMNAANRKMSLGMMGRIEYLNAELSYLNAKAAHESARLALVKAVQDYDWAMHGLISESSY